MAKLGGKREGAGRPKGEEKKALGIRVPVAQHDYLIEVVKKAIKKSSKK